MWESISTRTGKVVSLLLNTLQKVSTVAQSRSSDILLLLLKVLGYNSENPLRRRESKMMFYDKTQGRHELILSSLSTKSVAAHPWHDLLIKMMGIDGFNFLIFLTLIQYAVAWILLAFFKSLSLLPMSPPSKTTPFSSLFSLGAVMAFAFGLTNTSLKHNSVGFYQMAKITVTPTIVFAEFVLFKKTISSTKVIGISCGITIHMSQSPSKG